MLIYLARHGEAMPSESDPGLSDHGKAQVRKVAVFLAQKSIILPAIYHSGKRRAEETAELIAKQLQPKPTLTLKSGIKPDDNVEAMAAELSASGEDVMLVSHLPFLPKLVASCLHLSENALPVVFTPATVSCLEQLDDQWKVIWTINPDRHSEPRSG